jgi:hypothetical protein
MVLKSHRQYQLELYARSAYLPSTMGAVGRIPLSLAGIPIYSRRSRYQKVFCRALVRWDGSRAEWPAGLVRWATVAAWNLRRRLGRVQSVAAGGVRAPKYPSQKASVIRLV